MSRESRRVAHPTGARGKSFRVNIPPTAQWLWVRGATTPFYSTPHSFFPQQHSFTRTSCKCREQAQAVSVAPITDPRKEKGHHSLSTAFFETGGRTIG